MPGLYEGAGTVHKDLLLEADARRLGVDLDLGYPEFTESLRGSLASCLRREHQVLLPDRDWVLRRPWWALVLTGGFLARGVRAARRSARWVTVAAAIMAAVAILLIVQYVGKPSPAVLASVLTVAALAFAAAGTLWWDLAWLRFIRGLAAINWASADGREQMNGLLGRTERRWPGALWQVSLRRLVGQAGEMARRTAGQEPGAAIRNACY